MCWRGIRFSSWPGAFVGDEIHLSPTKPLFRRRSFSYFVSVIACFYDWARLKQDGTDTIYCRKLMHERARGWWRRAILTIDYYFVSNALFLLGIVGDVYTTYTSEIFGVGDGTLGKLAYLLGGLLWMVGSFHDGAQALLDRQNRRILKARVQVWHIV